MTVTGIQSGYSTKGVRPRAERHTNDPYEARINSIKRELAALKKRYAALDEADIPRESKDEMRKAIEAEITLKSQEITLLIVERQCRIEAEAMKQEPKPNNSVEKNALDMNELPFEKNRLEQLQTVMNADRKIENRVKSMQKELKKNGFDAYKSEQLLKMKIQGKSNKLFNIGIAPSQ